VIRPVRLASCEADDVVPSVLLPLESPSVDTPVCTPPSTSAVPSAAEVAACELVPSDVLSLIATSRIAASMNTWRRGSSSSRITPFTATKSRPLDITITLFVALSAITRTWPSSIVPSESIAAGDAGGGTWSCLVAVALLAPACCGGVFAAWPVIAVLITCASSSAIAFWHW